MMRKKENIEVKITAIMCLTILAIVCVLKDIDHLILSTVSATIGGIAGNKFRKSR